MNLIRTLLALILVAVSGIHAEDKPPVTGTIAPVAEINSDGKWKPIAAVMGGVRMPRAELDKITLTLAGEAYEVAVEGEAMPDKGTCAIDRSTTPKRMTITSTDGPNKGKTFLAIFEHKDAVSMRVCYDLSGREFPKEFAAPKGTQLYLVGYRRQVK